MRRPQLFLIALPVLVLTLVGKAAVYDEFVFMCDKGASPDAIGRLANLIETNAPLSPTEYMDSYACLALYYNSTENKPLAQKFHRLYFQINNRDHDQHFVSENYQVDCATCQGTGVRKDDCPSCSGGRMTTRTTGQSRVCPGCRGAGFFSRSCMTCAGNRMVFSKTKAQASFKEFLSATLMLRADNDAPAFSARLDKSSREDFIKLYLLAKLKPVNLTGKVLQVIDNSTLLVKVYYSDLVVCVRKVGHGLHDDEGFREAVFPVEPYSYTAVLGNNRTVGGYTTEIFEAAVFALGKDALLDLFQARDAENIPSPVAATPEGEVPETASAEGEAPSTDRARIDNMLSLKTMTPNSLAVGASESGYKHGSEVVTRIGRAGLEVFEKFKGKDLVIPIHPISSGEPAVLDFSKFTKGTKGVLHFSLTGRDAQSSGKASITRSTTPVWSKIPGKEWHEVEVEFDHEPVLIRVQTVKWANDWVYVTYRFVPR
jgi:hypothetical protein